MTAPASIYPHPVDDLLPAARALREQLGEVPSRNRLMRELRIGAPKATELRTALVVEDVAAFEASLTELDGPEVDPWEYAEPIGPGPAPDLPDLADVDPEDRPLTRWADDAPTAKLAGPQPAENPQVAVDGHPGTDRSPAQTRPVSVWPVVLLALPAFVAIWSGWVGLGGLTGFGVVHPLPGIWDSFSINSAITLPIGVETYGAYALYIWLSGRVPDRARRFAKWSAILSLLIGALGQVAYHLLVAAGVTSAPWWITTAVACLPVAVLGMGAALAHLVSSD